VANSNYYNPDYNLAISCGSTESTPALDKRIWLGDINSNLFSIIEPKTTDSSFVAHPNSYANTKFPFTTARISLSNFTYSFSINITNSPVFLRLHFYPTSYQNFQPSNANFSVEVNNNLTLLKNFNPSRWLYDDDDGETITKEYCIQIKPNENLLNITFIPNTINQLNPYYAFINAIEVVSVPSFLYYTDPNDLDYHIKSLDYDNDNTEYNILKDKALEMVYRVNVGLKPVPPNEDTGMFRNWEIDSTRYLEKEYLESVSSEFGKHLNYLNNTIPNYTAPELVYLTARSYGKHVKEDYNMTWNFEVDSSFTYMVRLHFCEFQEKIKEIGDKIFQIFIDDTLAEIEADVLEWTHGVRLVPVHKDYVVTMDSPRIERLNLSIKLQREPKTIMTKYLDATLNGIEIFKISDKYNNLAGLNPAEHIIISSPNQQALARHHSKSKRSTIVMVVVVGVSCLLLAFVVGMIVFVRRRRIFEFHPEMEERSWKTKKEGSSSLPSHLCRYFTIAEIRAATNNFDDIFIIGVGGFGNVYKGYIDDGTPVAIKRLKSGSQQGVNEFMNEIELLSQLRHIHLVSLIGYCNEGAEMILVYDF
ncbi:receptor-like protein kinase FERONIA-like protein, partial [Trifolium pratense]